MKRKRQRDPFKVGILVVILIAAVSYWTFTRQIPFVSGYQVHAIFASSNQLKPNSPVRIAGVDVGKVKTISRGPGTTMDVTMEISSAGQPLHRDATVKIKPRLFLEGGFFVEMYPGTPSAPKMKSGGTIPLGHTTGTVQFHQILTALDHDTRKQIKSTLRVTADALDKQSVKSIQDLAHQLTPTLKDVAILTQALQGTQQHDVSRFVAGAAGVSGTLARHDAQLADTIASLNRVSTALASTDGALAATVRGVDALFRSAPADLSAFQSALPALAKVSAAVLPAARIAPPVLDETSAFLTQLAGLSSQQELRGLVTKLGPTIQGFPKLEQGIDTLLPLAKSATDCVSQRLLATLDKPLPDGALSSGEPAYADFIHSLVGLASAAQDYDGNGPWVRYLGSLGNNTVSLGDLAGLVNNPISGARPVWFGPLNDSAAYHPEVPCLSTPLPDLNQRASASQAAAAVSSYHMTGRAVTPGAAAQSALRSLLHDPAKLRSLLKKAGR